MTESSKETMLEVRNMDMPPPTKITLRFDLNLHHSATMSSVLSSCSCPLNFHHRIPLLLQIPHKTVSNKKSIFL